MKNQLKLYAWVDILSRSCYVVLIATDKSNNLIKIKSQILTNSSVSAFFYLQKSVFGGKYHSQ